MDTDMMIEKANRHAKEAYMALNESSVDVDPEDLFRVKLIALKLVRAIEAIKLESLEAA